MAEQQLNRPHVSAGLEQMYGERVSQGMWRNRLANVAAPLRLLTDLLHGASRQGARGIQLGKSQRCGRVTCHHARSSSSSLGESITYRSFWPLPCSTRMTTRLLSMSVGFRWSASEMRRPAA
jgi:hypothetical protein